MPARPTDNRRRRGRWIALAVTLAVIASVAGACLFGVKLAHLSSAATPIPDVSPHGVIFQSDSIIRCDYISIWGFEGTITLPSSVKAGEPLVEQIDGQNSDAFPVSSVADFSQQPDGRWVKEVRMSTLHVIANCALRTSDMAYGVHILTIADKGGHVLAQGFYQMVAPIIVSSAAAKNGFVIDCDNPADVTMQIYLPSSIQDGDVLTERNGLDSTVGTITVKKTQLARQDDGTWLYTRTATAADIRKECTTPGGTADGVPLGRTGTNELQVIDHNGYILSDGDYNTLAKGTPATPAPTPTPVQIQFVPDSFSCVAPSDLTFTVRLPASLRAGEAISAVVDGPPDAYGTHEWGLGFDTVPVGPSTMTQQSDGTWLYARTFPVAQTRRMCAGNGQSRDYADDGDLVAVPLLTPGIHTLKVLDAGYEVLAEGSYTVEPYPQAPIASPSGTLGPGSSLS